MVNLGKCKDCGKPISKESTGRCKTCSNKSRRIYDIPRHQRITRKEYQKWYMKNIYHEKKKKIDKNYVQRLRKEVYDLLGNKCIKCGYIGLALQIDHVNDDGAKERKRFHCANATFLNHVLRKLKENSKEYQLLCANCNTEKEFERRGFNIRMA